MRCPFLRETSVKYCRLCRLKMIPQTNQKIEDERCSGPDYVKCSLAQEHHEGMLPQEKCPFLVERKAQSCTASNVSKLIPYNENQTSRCTNDGHRYCRLYLSMAQPQVKDLPELKRTDNLENSLSQSAHPQRPHSSSPAIAVPIGAKVEYVEDIPVPVDLSYSLNHLWVDSGDGQSYHIGVDAFLARVLGRVDKVSFPSYRGEGRPVVRLGVAGVDFDLVFTSAIEITEINAHLTVDPSDLINDPYGRGWLFEGVHSSGKGNRLEEDLYTGSEATRWMQTETNRLAQFVADQQSEHGTEVGLVMQDGGWIVGSLADMLDRGGLVRLHNEFFSLHHRQKSM